jgi:hypothetical protein
MLIYYLKIYIINLVFLLVKFQFYLINKYIKFKCKIKIMTITLLLKYIMN